MSDHLTPEDSFEFIDRGGGRGPAGHHLMDCPECLYVLDMILVAQALETGAENTWRWCWGRTRLRAGLPYHGCYPVEHDACRRTHVAVQAQMAK